MHPLPSPPFSCSIYPIVWSHSLNPSSLSWVQSTRTVAQSCKFLYWHFSFFLFVLKNNSPNFNQIGECFEFWTTCVKFEHLTITTTVKHVVRKRRDELYRPSSSKFTSIFQTKCFPHWLAVWKMPFVWLVMRSRSRSFALRWSMKCRHSVGRYICNIVDFTYRF